MTMKQSLTIEEQKRLDGRVAEFEKRTGCQVVLAVVERSDSYAEIPWKAFALGAAAAGLAVTVYDLLRPGWQSSTMVLVSVSATLLCGAACAMACIALPTFAHLFLDKHRAEVESRQYAESLFLSREVFATRGRTGILVMASLFEHQVVMLPDKGVAGRVTKAELESVISAMTGPLAAGRVAEAMEQGLSALEAILSPTAPKGRGVDELPNTVIQEKGE